MTETIEEKEESNTSKILNDDIVDDDFQVIQNEDNLLENLDRVIDTEENNYLDEKSQILDSKRHKDFEDQDASFRGQTTQKHDTSYERLEYQPD